eukprot:6701876-Prymnesium_polylepis.1
MQPHTRGLGISFGATKHNPGCSHLKGTCIQTVLSPHILPAAGESKEIAAKRGGSEKRLRIYVG